METRSTLIVGQHHQHLSKCTQRKRACTSLAEGKIKELTKLKAPRGMYSAKTPPTESPPATQSHPPVGMHTLQTHTVRNTTFVTQKAIALQMFGACISSGMGILESCKVAGIATGFNDQVVWKWAKAIYVDFFGILTSLEDVTEDRLDKELHTHTYIYILSEIYLKVTY